MRAEDRPTDEQMLQTHPRVHWRGPPTGARRPRRIVSLVPSLSEALVALGLGDRLVGVTQYCVHPPEAFAALPRLGGTKDADVEAIAALAPDLVIANQEENTARVVRQLAERGIDVWVTYPRSVREGAELLRELSLLAGSSRLPSAPSSPPSSPPPPPPRSRPPADPRPFRAHDPPPAQPPGADPATIAARVVDPVFAALESAERDRAQQGQARRRVFCAIWRDPWMTIGRDTYIHDMLTLCGGENVFGAPSPPVDASERAGGDRRYPIVTLEQIERAAPDVILLPDEPYAFGPVDAEALSRLDCAAARSGSIHLIDGTLVSWYGPRIAEAIRVLAGILAAP